MTSSRHFSLCLINWFTIFSHNFQQKNQWLYVVCICITVKLQFSTWIYNIYTYAYPFTSSSLSLFVHKEKPIRVLLVFSLFALLSSPHHHIIKITVSLRSFEERKHLGEYRHDHESWLRTDWCEWWFVVCIRIKNYTNILICMYSFSNF